MAKFSAKGVWEALRRQRGRWFAMRQAFLGRALSGLYGAPMQVLPRGHAGLAAAAVLWYVQDGQRNIVMVRNPKGRDSRARLISCLGLSGQADMSLALRNAMELQLGKVFARSVDRKLLLPDRVAAAPLFSYMDDVTGVESPVQVLAWVVQIMPVQVELMAAGSNLELVIVNEATLEAGLNAGANISPTHRAIWQSVARHLPPMRSGKRGDGVEEVSLDAAELKKGGARTVH